MKKNNLCFSFEVYISYSSRETKITVQSHSRSGAVYAAYERLGRIDYCSFKNFILSNKIRVKKLGEVKKEHFYPKTGIGMEMFNSTLKSRGIADFCKLGTKVIVPINTSENARQGIEGSAGFVVNSDSSCNLVVWIPCLRRITHCHPHYKIKYLDENDLLIKEY